MRCGKCGEEGHMRKNGTNEESTFTSWFVYFLILASGDLGLSHWVLAVIWRLLNPLCFTAVPYGLEANILYLLAALCISVSNIIAGIVTALIHFITFNWFAACCWLLMIVELTVYYYYALWLVTVLDSHDSPAAGKPAYPGKDELLDV